MQKRWILAVKLHMVDMERLFGAYVNSVSKIIRNIALSFDIVFQLEPYKNSLMERKFWVDAVKAMCMAFVYLLHSQIYYGWSGHDHVYFALPFYVNAFFFVSGYLFYGKWLFVESSLLTKNEYKKSLCNVFFRIVVPMLLFSTLIYLPKQMFHGNELNIGKYAIDVLGGISYWFTATLAVAQLILLTAIFVLKKRQMWIYIAVSLICLGAGMYLRATHPGNAPEDYFPWYYQLGLECTFLMSCGGVYRCYEDRINKVMKYGLIVVFVIYIVILVWCDNIGRKLLLLGLEPGLNCDALGLVCVLCGITLLTALCRWLRPMGWLAYIGRNSLVLYFFSGVYPAMVSAVVHRLPLPDLGYAVVAFVAVLSFLFGNATVFVIQRYLPFMLDLRKLKR